ncbi:MAG: hypothetical protein ABI586_01985 [Candidatus Nanopelagicales bacterium]
MAKALLGHIGGPDTRLLAEVAILRRRVRDLEAEIMRLAAENDSLLTVGGQVGDEIIALDARESVSAAPALA